MKENNNVINIINTEGQLSVSSREVANNFGKEHGKVIRSIESYIEDVETIEAKNGLYYTKETDTKEYSLLFIQSEYKASNGKSNKEYLLTRDGFSLLVMGFTGRKALQWKLNYIEAFNKMEEQLKEEPKQIEEKASIKDVNQALDHIMPLLDTKGVSTESKLLVTKDLYKKAGVELPIEIKAREKFYDTKQIASIVKIYSKSNKPHMQAVNIIISKLDIKEEEQDSVWESNGSWHGTVVKYTKSVIEKVLKWLIDNEYPSKIEAKTKDKSGKEKTKNFHVVYKHEEVASC